MFKLDCLLHSLFLKQYHTLPLALCFSSECLCSLALSNTTTLHFPAFTFSFLLIHPVKLIHYPLHCLIIFCQWTVYTYLLQTGLPATTPPYLTLSAVDHVSFPTLAFVTLIQPSMYTSKSHGDIAHPHQHQNSHPTHHSCRPRHFHPYRNI